MDIVRGMEVFVAVVDGGSFVAAADKLDMSTAAISRQVAALEAHLGARLFNRTTRRLSLTQPGMEFHERARQILADIQEAEAVAGEYALKPAGLLRISAPLSFGVRALGELLPDFRRQFPDLRLDVDLSDRVVDLVHDGVDVALRIAQTPSPNLIARRIAPVRMLVCASPGYLAAHGTPQHPSELAEHAALSYTYLSSGDNWLFNNTAGQTELVRAQPAVRANNGDLLRQMALQDGGVIVQPNFILADDIAAGRLVQILPDWTIGSFSLYAVYLSRRFLSAKVRVFIDFLSARMGNSEI
ncbi:LysR family transcriptional regulator [Rhizobium sp. ACO-34A]|nr:LysR family transcriptional regulator [Rhizobium sp. ACO-34A]ATN35373.1 LysR family transcriptional regulator [Rhizobium sp. ACO-34A]